MKLDEFYPNLNNMARTIKILESTEPFGGPQTIKDIMINLKTTNTNARSIMYKLCKNGKIKRIKVGLYCSINSKTSFDKNKPHLE